MSELQPEPEERLYERIAAILDESRSRVARSINTAMVHAYWHIGREIVEVERHGAERAGYGEGLMKRVAKRLSARFGKGFSLASLKRMKQFYLAFPGGSALVGAGDRKGSNAVEPFSGPVAPVPALSGLVALPRAPARHASPSMSRLRRWLGSASTKAALGKRAGEALEACPKQATRQRALLHLLSHDFAAAAKLLASAPGLVWSNGEHPGHLLFPLFAQLLGASRTPARRDLDPMLHRAADLDELEAMTTDPEEPRLTTPEVDALLVLAGVASISDATSRRGVLAAMKKAAESRAAGVTAQKRRRRYGHAAELVATCVACDKTDETKRWAAALQAEDKRFPALRDELEQAARAR